jgi:hypothetical protein
MVDRPVTLVADTEVEIEGGLTLPVGRYAALERRIEVPELAGRKFTEPDYFIEFDAGQITAMGFNPGQLDSAECYVTPQVRDGRLKRA